jgi:asparagine synthase (glutamine-hydrolysing)
MCGIAGYVLQQFKRRDLVNGLNEALKAISHRGPDDAGVALIHPAGFANNYRVAGTHVSLENLEQLDPGRPPDHLWALGHRRFSIIDTSAAGHQPFWDDEAQVCATFNGEIYNYVEIRRQLEQLGMQFRTTSDTEVLVKGYIAWGTECFQRFNGFWAIALADIRRGSVLLSRDRLGKAPLFVYHAPGSLFWCSEVKGLLRMAPTDAIRPDQQSIFDFANWLRRDIHDRSFFEGVTTFPAGSFAWVRLDGTYEAKRYWEIPRIRLTESHISVSEAAARLESILTDAVRIRLRADVPVATQLSGGIDSSSLVAIAASIQKPIDSYTVKFPEKQWDEEPFARQVAERYADAINYHVVEPPSSDLVNELDEYTDLMEAPYHSPNQFTNHRIWRMMSDSGIRVVLYGAGGDEVFAGYGSEYFGPYLRHLLKNAQFSRLAKEILHYSESSGDRSIQTRIVNAARMLPFIPTTATHGFIRTVPAGCNPLRIKALAYIDSVPPLELSERLIANMQEWRMNYWLRIDNQNSMGVPIELRSPFLDHRLVELAFELPVTYLIRDGWLKWIVRYAMQDRLPASVVWRKRKMGFPFPLSSWLLQNKELFCGRISEIDCPYIDSKVFVNNYHLLAVQHANYAWGLLSLLLWWKSLDRWT